MYYLFFSHTQILTFFRQNVSSRAPFGQSGHIIPTFHSELNEDCEKNKFFFILSPKRGCFGGINRFDPHHFWTIFMQEKISGAICWPLRTKSKILKCTFFQKLYKLLR